jgi:Putative zinc finger in N-recognin (UBR box)
MMEEVNWRGRRSSSSGGSASNSGTGRYPVAAQLAFVPGGVSYAFQNSVFITNSSQADLIRDAKLADDRLRQYSLLYANIAAPTINDGSVVGVPHFLPSLSVLAEAAFGKLTGAAPDSIRSWADAMVLSQFGEDGSEQIPTNEDDILNAKQAAPARSPLQHPDTSVPTLLKRILQETERQAEATSSSARRRPCGYVFKRGDIAWNCKTCQADQTCVICDDCFQKSNHEGHEVYFHRTTPGGCCDCGDFEAWHVKIDEKETNRPELPELEDPMEAVRIAAQARKWSIETLTSDPATRLPKRFLAALGVVIGSAVHCLLDAVDGSGVASDGVQWTKRWADEAARVSNSAPHNEDYVFYSPNDFQSGPLSVQTYTMLNKNFAENFRLHLRLHNDDVHTFDEVIDALHEPQHIRRTSNEDHHPSLVSLRENATEMTHHVDSDGQVTVKTYNNVASAMRGFRRLKSRGLHCAVVSTAQMDAENRAKVLCAWLSDVASAHPAAQALLVQALVQLKGRSNGGDGDLGGVQTWHPARMISPWTAITIAPEQQYDEIAACRRRFDAFPPHLSSSYVTREEAELLHGMTLATLADPSNVNVENFLQVAGTLPHFYSNVPYRLPSQRYHKSPHALWGTLPSEYSDPVPLQCKHPLLERLLTGQSDLTTKNQLTESVYVVDTDLRKQQEGERITLSVFPHKLPGLNMISGVGISRVTELDARRPPLPSPMDLRHLLGTSSYRAPLSPILLLLLLDPYPTKQVRGALHVLFLSLLTNGRFKARFAGALSVAYRPLSTLFCAGVGTEADTPLHFTVQIFTAGSIVRALGHGPSTERLLLSDEDILSEGQEISSDATPSSIGVFVPPLAHVIARCIHTNLLGATKEVNMILNNTASGNDDDSQDEGNDQANLALLPALTYVAGEHPLMTPLPAAPDDGFLDSRSTRHKRLPHLLRDLDYVIETPGTAMRLLLPSKYPVYQGPTLSFRGEDVLAFPAIFSRMLRLAQGMDPQKRKISGGHVEYEQNRWLEAFGLSLNFGGTRDSLAESPCTTSSLSDADVTAHISAVQEAVGNAIASLLREIKLWLYREGMLETGLPIPPGGANGAMDLAQVEALQRSTLHVSSIQYGSESTLSINSASDFVQGGSSTVALSCATGVKMTEAQLTLIENALKLEAAQQLEYHQSFGVIDSASKPSLIPGPIMGDWLRVPHSPLAGDSLSFHLPLHRALAKCVKSICSVIVPEEVIVANPNSWWKIPILDQQINSHLDQAGLVLHPLVAVIRPTLRSSNCRIVWTAGPECNSQEAQRRRLRSRTVSANIAVAKVIHSLADHPIRCLAAAQQIERHLWARNGTSVAGMAINYSSAPLCRSFRDLDLLLVQLSAAGLSCGLGARRVFALLLSRFSMDGYLCDPERRAQVVGGTPFTTSPSIWINPPRLQDPEHAVVLAESFFSTLCVLVTELPPPPPKSSSDDSSLRRSIRRELLHALAAEPRSHSEAMTAASCGISRREESEGTSGKGGSGGHFRDAFTIVLNEVGKQKNQTSTRATSGPATFELKPDLCDEYDPTFFHLRRQEHQHAMDVVAMLRKQKLSGNKEALETHCLPLVCAPPKAHPRFLPCRLLLHLDAMDAALRRSLLFALTSGSWLPPLEPSQEKSRSEEDIVTSTDTIAGVSTSIMTVPSSADIPMTSFNRRIYQSQSSGASFPRRPGAVVPPPFSPEVVAGSSVSFIEVLQLLTLQVHTLEECASFHRMIPDLESEAKSLSSSLSINSYLRRLVHVPDSLIDVWALRPSPAGPLTSRGSGENRGSILGLLIALYEHRSDHGAILDEDGTDFVPADDGHGGARSLASSGLKWLLRFVNALVDGAPSVGAATKSATTGVPLRSAPQSNNHGDAGSGAWSINEEVRSGISGMLKNLPDLWPKLQERPSSSPDKSSTKSKEVRKAAQQRVMDLMKKKQAAFAATISPVDAPVEGTNEASDQETDLCIICRCDDADGENNGPIGYLGHVQRSRVVQMRAVRESFEKDENKPALVNTYRVVGHMGCQVKFTVV